MRYPQIRRRITVRNRRRVAVVATAVAVALAIAGGYAGLPRQRVAPDPIAPSSAPARPADFPPYAFGRKLIVQASAPISEGKLTVTWTRDKPDFHFTLLCTGLPQGVMLRGPMLVNGNVGQEFLCSDRGGNQSARTEDWTRSGWIRPGEAITLSFTVEEAVIDTIPEDTPVPMPGSGTIAVGIFVPVPFEEYQLPPRPDPLPGLADWSDCPLDLFVRSDPRDPVQPMTGKMVWGGDPLIFRWDTQTPGLLTIAIDGVTLATVGYWDYGGLNWSRLWNGNDLAAIPGWKFPAKGSEVTITMTAQHFTGQWQAGLRYMESDLDYGPCG